MWMLYDKGKYITVWHQVLLVNNLNSYVFKPDLISWKELKCITCTVIICLSCCACTCVELWKSVFWQINSVVGSADELVRSNHYAAEKIRRKADSLAERRDVNRQRARDKLNRLKDFLHLQKFLQVQIICIIIVQCVACILCLYRGRRGATLH